MRSAARWADAATSSSTSRSGSSGRASSRARDTLLVISVRMLLKSWAIPPASTPTASIFWAWSNCAWILSFSSFIRRLCRATAATLPKCAASRASSSLNPPGLFASPRIPRLQPAARKGTNNTLSRAGCPCGSASSHGDPENEFTTRASPVRYTSARKPVIGTGPSTSTRHVLSPSSV